jgi:uncharacterized membrane-anchored protein YhcB (DUF1043 family)
MLGSQAVHTTGLNWDSLLVITCAIVTVVGSALGFIIRTLRSNRDRTEQFIQAQVHNVTDALAGRLDRVDEHLLDQDRAVSLQNERLAKVEGQLLGLPFRSSDSS